MKIVLPKPGRAEILRDIPFNYLDDSKLICLPSRERSNRVVVQRLNYGALLLKTTQHFPGKQTIL